MPWIRRKLRGNFVYVHVDDGGTPVADPDGRVAILYKLSASAKVYRANPNNLHVSGNPADEVPVVGPTLEDLAPPGGDGAATKGAAGNTKGAKSNSKRTAPAAVPDDALIIWTDGACTGNPGPMGIGAVIIDKEQRREISEFLGQGTNNIAELVAIERALETVPAEQRSRPIVIHTDSSYSIGLLSKGWKAKANTELVARIRRLVSEFAALHFVKVRGHAGIEENERCDELAREAITAR